MIKNYFKIGIRNLWKNKGFSSLNILGLAIGIACASFIFLWLEDELSFDAIQDKELVYYVPTNQKYEGEWRTFYSTPGPLAPDLKAEIPEIAKAARTFGEEMLISVGDNSISRYGRFADADLFDIFSLEFLEGNKKEAFRGKNTIVLTRGTADILFGKNTRALGKELWIDNSTSYKVSGVIKDLPKNMTFEFTWLAPYKGFSEGKEWTQRYGSNFADTFVKLHPGSDFKAVNTKVKRMISSKSEDTAEAMLHPATSWHLRSEFKGGKSVGGRITYVRLFGAIAIIILIIACINFMNLSTARSENRANEVGVRKALGSGKKQLIQQFLIESLVTAVLATFVGLILLVLFIQPFNNLVNKQLVLGFTDPDHILFLLSITLICGILAGLYPAFYLSSFNPIKALKGEKTNKGNTAFIRKGLVVTQFVVSIVFISTTIIVYQQVQHIKGRDLGFERENLVRIRTNNKLIENFSAIKNDLLATGKIQNAAMSNTALLAGGNNGSGLTWQGGKQTEDVLISFRRITPELFDTAGMKIIEGRGFHGSAEQDKTNVLVSQSFADLMGEGSAIGRTVTRGETYTVIGVVQDYVYDDMYGSGDPVMFFNEPEQAQFLYIKTNATSDLSSTLSEIQSVLEIHNQGYPFEYKFVDDAFDERFKSEQLMGDLSSIFAILAIVISCLGLFGLSAFTAEQRRREIGVRKVLGSSVAGIVALLTSDFLRLVIISILIAMPIGWFLMQDWLQGFAYRTSLNWWVFALAGFTAILIAVLTISYQAVKAAVANPIKSLRTE